MGTKAQTGINRTDKSGLVFCRVLNGYNCRVLVAMIPQKSIESVLYRVLAGTKRIRRVQYETFFLVLIARIAQKVFAGYSSKYWLCTI